MYACACECVLACVHVVVIVIVIVIVIVCVCVYVCVYVYMCIYLRQCTHTHHTVTKPITNSQFFWHHHKNYYVRFAMLLLYHGTHTYQCRHPMPVDVCVRVYVCVYVCTCVCVCVCIYLLHSSNLVQFQCCYGRIIIIITYTLPCKVYTIKHTSQLRGLNTRRTSTSHTHTRIPFLAQMQLCVTLSLKLLYISCHEGRCCDKYDFNSYATFIV